MSCITFEELEGRTERTYAFVLLTRFAHASYGVFLLFYAARRLKKFIKTVSRTDVTRFSADNIKKLLTLLRGLHEGLLDLCSYADQKELGNIPILGNPVRSIEDSTEDLGDIIEAIQLSSDQEFKALVTEGIKKLDLSSGRSDRDRRLETVHR